MNVKACLDSTDPLSEEAFRLLISHHEEDSLVDYKEIFDSDNEKSWVDLAIDISALSNTHGGYIVFGVQDKSYKRIGLSEKSIHALCDIKKVCEKVSRNIRPGFKKLRSKKFELDGTNFVALFVPATVDRTHIFEEDMQVNFGGKPVVLAKKGAIYVRKSGSNQVLTSDDFEDLLQRRIKRFREKILDGVSRVVKAEPEQEILIVSAESEIEPKSSIKVIDAPDGMRLKGVNFVVDPKNVADKISVWRAAYDIDSRDLPNSNALMEMYAARETVELELDQIRWLILASLINNAPTFYWINIYKGKDIREIFKEAFKKASRLNKFYILKAAFFISAGLYEEILRSSEGSSIRGDVKPISNKVLVFGTDQSEDERDIGELDLLSIELTKEFDQQKLYRVQKLDCALYAPF
jgi:Putative DNA-binding domain